MLLRVAFSGNRILIGMCEEPYHHREWLWTFVDEPGIEPTNNASERSLRDDGFWHQLEVIEQADVYQAWKKIAPTSEIIPRGLSSPVDDSLDGSVGGLPLSTPTATSSSQH